MRRQVIAIVGALVLVVTTLTFVGAPTGAALPIADNDATYERFKRVFPDPHGCLAEGPGVSPWAKGEVCAVQFIQYDEALVGVKYLEQRFPRYISLLNLAEQFGEQFPDEEMLSAGLPREDMSRLRSPLHVVKLTDADSPVPEADRKHFAYSLSIHGIERAGIEGGIRAAEDLVTWAACDANPDAAPGCADEGPFPKPILEPTDSGPTATETLQNAVIYLVLANPDGWRRGDLTEGGLFYQRYNGNGMDLNRDWPTVGYTEAQYTPGSEPETRGFAAFLKSVRERTTDNAFAGAIDLHGMIDAPSFSFTLLGAGQRDYRRNAVTVDTAIKTFQDSEARLSWSDLIATHDEGCPGDTGNIPMCSDQWGTVWDTINYQITGGFADWMESPLGLDAVGIDNEMALSHLAPNNVFVPEVEQLHIDGNKGLIFSQIAAMLQEERAEFTPDGTVGYIVDQRRTSHPGGGPADGGPAGMPTQDTIRHRELTGISDVEFDVKDIRDGFFNGGLTIEATFANVAGVSPNSVASLVLDYCGGADHVGDGSECQEVARYFNQSPLYLQAGARIDLNAPRAGTYRIRADGARILPTEYEISFSSAQAYEQPEQLAFDVSRMDFFDDLNEYVPAGSELTPITVADVLRGKGKRLDRFDTVVIAGDLMPGFSPDGEDSAFSHEQYQRYADALARFAQQGGNLVLTDSAVDGLPALGTGIAPEAITGGYYYAGWMDFHDGAEGEGPTYDRHPLAAGVDMEGTAEGADTVDGHSFANRHQTYEPVPIGYYVSPSGSANARCTADRCDSPNWIVDQQAWEAAGGSTAARTLVRTEQGPGDSEVGVSLGELPVGDGRIRIAGALLPEPSQENFHPYGLRSYSLTYTGYQLVENLLTSR